MKLFFSLAFLWYNYTSDIDVNVCRQLFSKASSDQIANEKLLDMTKSATLMDAPLAYAYHAGATMVMANHTYWPGTKLSYFNQGKVKLEKAVNFALMNVEIRFIRYSIQKEAPTILGYYENRAEDKAFILANLNNTKWTNEYKQEVKDFLNKK